MACIVPCIRTYLIIIPPLLSVNSARRRRPPAFRSLRSPAPKRNPGGVRRGSSQTQRPSASHRFSGDRKRLCRLQVSRGVVRATLFRIQGSEFQRTAKLTAMISRTKVTAFVIGAEYYTVAGSTKSVKQLSIIILTRVSSHSCLWTTPSSGALPK